MSAITGISTDVQLSLEGHTGVAWRVLGARVHERLSQPYRAEVLLHVHGELELDELVGASASLVARQRTHEQRLAGVVAEARLERVDTHGTVARLAIRPALWLLRHRKDSRIFQGRSVPEILREVLEPALAAHGRELRVELDGSYPAREHTVQYRETDLAFAERLMEEAGIVYAFDHAGEREVLVLTDRNAQHPSVVGREGDLLPYDDRGGASADVGDDSITHFAPVTSLVGSRVTGLGFDWTRPSQPATAQAEDPTDAFGLEWYDHELPLTLAGFAPREGYAQNDARDLVGRLHELQVRDRRVVEAESNAVSPRAGFHFTLEGHPRPELDGRYFVVESEHRFGSTRVERTAGARDGAQRDGTHTCRFTCVPSDTPWRPARVHDRPRIASVQTATVVGPAGEEIHTDEHGRIKVRFHWDRRASGDERSSTWIRVAQSMGGPGWGFSFIPRIGMEVVVTFVQGDPDKPLVTGVVYNGETPPPYDPSVDSTRTTIKTDSSPGHGGYHELRFEDRAGSEEVYLRSQKDWNIVIENDSTREVKRDERERVARDRERKVGHDEQLEVTGNREKSVGANQTEIVGGNRQRVVGVDEAVRVGGAQSIEIAAASSEAVSGKSTVQVTGAFTETVNGAMAVSIAQDSTTKVGGNQTTQVAGSQTTSVVGNVQETIGGSKSVRTGGDSVVKTGGTRTESIRGSMTRTADVAAQSAGVGRVTYIGGNDMLTVVGALTVSIDTMDERRTLMSSCTTTGSHTENVGAVYTVQTGHTESHAAVASLRFVVAKKVEIALMPNQIAIVLAGGNLDVQATGSVTLEGAKGVWLTSLGDTKLKGERVSLADPGFSRAAACRSDPLEHGVTVDPGDGPVKFAGLHPALVLDPATVIPKKGDPPVPGHVAMSSSKVFVTSRGVARKDDMCLVGGAGSSAAGQPTSISPAVSPTEQARFGDGPKFDEIPEDGNLASDIDTKLGPVEVKVLTRELGAGALEASEQSASFFAGLRGSFFQASVPLPTGPAAQGLVERARQAAGLPFPVQLPQDASLEVSAGQVLLGGRVTGGFDPATATTYFAARGGAAIEFVEGAVSGTFTLTPFDNALTDLFLPSTDPRVRALKNFGLQLTPKLEAGLGAGAKAAVTGAWQGNAEVFTAGVELSLGLGIKALTGMEIAAGQVGTAGMVKILDVGRKVFVG